MAATTRTEKTYLELISQDEKSLKSESLKLIAQENALNLNKEIFELDTEIAKLKSKLEASKRANPYSIAVEYSTATKMEELQKRVDFARQIKDVRFSDSQIQ